MVSAGRRPAAVAAGRVRADLVRLGLRPRLHRRADRRRRCRSSGELGFGWAVARRRLADRARATGIPIRSKFPRGDADMKALVEKIHARGAARRSCGGRRSRRIRARAPQREHPDWLLLQRGRHAAQDHAGGTRIYLCPAYAPVRADAAALRAQGARATGASMASRSTASTSTASPPCYNPAHHHAAPEDSVEGVPGFFEAIWRRRARGATRCAWSRSARAARPTRSSRLPFLNMTVASDPESSWQVRLKGKTLKALTGRRHRRTSAITSR